MIRYEDIAAAIQVRHLQVAIDEAVCFERQTVAQTAARLLAERGFDQAPVVDGEAVVGLVRSVDLRDGVATVGEALEPIRAEHLVSADAPVAKALAWLREVPCLFVLDGRQVTGFFVEADLNKQPARTYFYLLVASLEAGLARLLREWAGGDEARLLAATPRLVRDRAIKAREEARGEDVGNDHVKWPHRDHRSWPHPDRLDDLLTGC
jgi:CBS domain-containing protein